MNNGQHHVQFSDVSVRMLCGISSAVLQSTTRISAVWLRLYWCCRRAALLPAGNIPEHVQTVRQCLMVLAP
jgi:hypothetical protein